MEISGVIYRPMSAGINAPSQHSSVKLFPAGVSLKPGHRFSGESPNLNYGESRMNVNPIKLNGSLDCGFYHADHVQYYSASRPLIRCGGGKKEKHKEMKRKVKLFKGLSKNLSHFSEIGFGLDSDNVLANQVKGNAISEAAEILLKELQQVRFQEKELKRKKKEEKAKLKSTRKMQNREESSDSSSDSSDSDCEQVVNMSHIKTKAPENPTENAVEEQSQYIQESTSVQQEPTREESLTSTSKPVLVEESGSHTHIETCNNADNLSIQNSIPNGISEKRIEVCMGGKCKKSGGALMLLEEFKRVVGDEGSVVGCKCMGKCKDGPNVRVLNGVNGDEADQSAGTPSNSFCTGVGLEDVNLIVGKLFGADEKKFDLATAE